jgi:hypothetical protein
MSDRQRGGAVLGGTSCRTRTLVQTCSFVHVTHVPTAAFSFYPGTSNPSQRYPTPSYAPPDPR